MKVHNFQLTYENEFATSHLQQPPIQTIKQARRSFVCGVHRGRKFNLHSEFTPSLYKLTIFLHQSL